MLCWFHGGSFSVDVIITEWGLQAYLDLVGSTIITRNDYWNVLRPDVEKLKLFPQHHDFKNSRFWGPATDRGGNNIPDGFKMKWHNIGSGRVQLRLSVAILGNAAYLCCAYVKSSDSKDKREAAKLKDHIQDIYFGRHQVRGVLP